MVALFFGSLPPPNPQKPHSNNTQTGKKHASPSEYSAIARISSIIAMGVITQSAK